MAQRKATQEHEHFLWPLSQWSNGGSRKTEDQLGSLHHEDEALWWKYAELDQFRQDQQAVLCSHLRQLDEEL